MLIKYPRNEQKVFGFNSIENTIYISIVKGSPVTKHMQEIMNHRVNKGIS